MWPESPENLGVRPESPENLGVWPESPENLGVRPESPENLGVWPESPENLGVRPESPENSGVRPESPETCVCHVLLMKSWLPITVIECIFTISWDTAIPFWLTDSKTTTSLFSQQRK